VFGKRFFLTANLIVQPFKIQSVMVSSKNNAISPPHCERTIFPLPFVYCFFLLTENC
jgi:hypothetical protein